MYKNNAGSPNSKQNKKNSMVRSDFNSAHLYVFLHFDINLLPQTKKKTRLLCPQNSPSKNPGMGSHSLLQEIFPTQGSNPGLLHFRQILHHLSHQGKPINAI